MNVSQLLKSVGTRFSTGEWPATAWRKHLLAETNVVAYYFSSDADPDADAAQPHDREDDLFILGEETLTFYRLTTTGLVRSGDSTRVAGQRLEKFEVPVDQIGTVHLAWESVGAFEGDAPPLESRCVEVKISFDTELPIFGEVLTLPYRPAETERDGEAVWHEAETFAEAVLLQMEETRRIPPPAAEPRPPPPAADLPRQDPWGPGITTEQT